MPSEFSHPNIVSAYESVVAACRRHGKWVGMGGVPTEDGMAPYIAMGVRFVLSGADFGFMMAGATARAAGMRRIHPGR